MLVHWTGCGKTQSKTKTRAQAGTETEPWGGPPHPRPPTPSHFLKTGVKQQLMLGQGGGTNPAVTRKVSFPLGLPLRPSCVSMLKHRPRYDCIQSCTGPCVLYEPFCLDTHYLPPPKTGGSIPSQGAIIAQLLFVGLSMAPSLRTPVKGHGCEGEAVPLGPLSYVLI